MFNKVWPLLDLRAELDFRLTMFLLIGPKINKLILIHKFALFINNTLFGNLFFTIFNIHLFCF